MRLIEGSNNGRERIVLDYEEITPENVLDALDDCLEVHRRNKQDCEYLIDYILKNYLAAENIQMEHL